MELKYKFKVGDFIFHNPDRSAIWIVKELVPVVKPREGNLSLKDRVHPGILAINNNKIERCFREDECVLESDWRRSMVDHLDDITGQMIKIYKFV